MPFVTSTIVQDQSSVFVHLAQGVGNLYSERLDRLVDCYLFAISIHWILGAKQANVIRDNRIVGATSYIWVKKS